MSDWNWSLRALNASLNVCLAAMRPLASVAAARLVLSSCTNASTSLRKAARSASALLRYVASAACTAAESIVVVDALTAVPAVGTVVDVGINTPSSSVAPSSDSLFKSSVPFSVWSVPAPEWMVALKANCIALHCETVLVPSLETPAALMVTLDGVSTTCTDSVVARGPVVGAVPEPPPQPNNTHVASAQALRRARRDNDRVMLSPTIMV